jgi:hypothetical protein
MKALSSLGKRLQQILIDAAERQARSSGFVQRQSKLTASRFIQTLVFAWMADATASRQHLAVMAGLLGVDITAEGISHRFNDGAVRLLQGVLTEATQMLLFGAKTSLRLLERFTAVWVFDASSVSLPRQLAEDYPGCGDCHGSTSGLKLHLGLDLLSGRLMGPEVTPASTHDRRAEILQTPLESGSLVIRDLGYFSLKDFQQMTEQGIYWLSRLKTGTRIRDLNGQPIDLLELLKPIKRGPEKQLERPVLIGAMGLPGRLLVRRVSPEQAAKRRRSLRRSHRRKGAQPSKTALILCDFTIAVTNLAQEQLSLAEAMTLLRARWQIEMLFKLCKSHGEIDQWQSQRPVAILCEVHAKILAMLLTHWITLSGAWQQADRSIFRAAAVVRSAAEMIAAVINKSRGLKSVLATVTSIQRRCSRVTHRKKHPSTFQQILAFNDP